MTDSFDLIVLGSGPGGYVAAIRAAQLGLKVAVVEREQLGGVCLNWGCIPTKALLRTAEIHHYITHASDYGLAAEQVGFDLGRVVARSRQVAGQLNAGVKGLMRKNRIAVFEGDGALAGRGRVLVSRLGEAVELAGKDILIATGARARELPFAKADGARVWTYRHAMVPREMPSSLLVVGSGAIGVEFASFYSDMGAKVTLIEALDRILPAEDVEVSAFMTKALEKRGLRVLTGARLEALEAGPEAVSAVIRLGDEPPRAQAFSHAIVAIGIRANIEAIGLETLGVALKDGHVLTDACGRTSVDGVWAIGDVAGPPWLAHKASHEGVVAAEAIAGVQGVHPVDKANIAACTYSRPQVASVGLTEAAARLAGRELKIGKFPFAGNGKAIALGAPEGFVKTIFDAMTGELLGAHMVGAEVTELIQGYVISRQLEATGAELADTVFPHPTLSEALHESVLSAAGRALHV